MGKSKNSDLLDEDLLGLMDELDNLSVEEIEGIYNEIKRLRKRKENFKQNKKTKVKKLENDNSQSLLGKFLVYIGETRDELYDKAVVYVTECDADNVRGIIINKRLFGSASIECKMLVVIKKFAICMRIFIKVGLFLLRMGLLSFLMMIIVKKILILKCSVMLLFLPLLVFCKKFLMGRGLKRKL